MTLIQWLNKLGILRWGGAKGVYHNAKERPIELQDPGVFNADRDLVGRRDTTKNTTHEGSKPTHE